LAFDNPPDTVFGPWIGDPHVLSSTSDRRDRIFRCRTATVAAQEA